MNCLSLYFLINFVIFFSDANDDLFESFENDAIENYSELKKRSENEEDQFMNRDTKFYRHHNSPLASDKFRRDFASGDEQLLNNNDENVMLDANVRYILDRLKARDVDDSRHQEQHDPPTASNHDNEIKTSVGTTKLPPATSDIFNGKLILMDYSLLYFYHLSLHLSPSLSLFISKIYCSIFMSTNK